MTARKEKTIWIATLDGARANFYSGTTPVGRLAPVPGGAMKGTRALTHEMTTDRPGHTHESVGGGRHAMEPRTDAHKFAETKFVKKVAVKLKQSAEGALFDELIVIAAPHALGDLRDALGPAFRKRYVIDEIPGDWTKLSATEVSAHLQHHFETAG